MNRFAFAFVVLCLIECVGPLASFAETTPQVERVLLTEEFNSEGACIADIDGDGANDIVSGCYWYRGPEFRERHAYTSGGPYSIKAYSQFFFCFSHDFNSDQRPDILVVGFPGAEAFWFENPGVIDGDWKKHLAIGDVSNESPIFDDITGDGVPELVCISGGGYGYAKPGDDPTLPWQFVKASNGQGLGRFTHGMGVGDVNGDGRADILETRGWWEQTETPGELFAFHAYPFAQAGGSQMFAYDFDADGDNDVVAVQNAHGWGLRWFEQRGSGDDISFIPHDILPDKEDTNASLNISQMHALSLADMDGDGVKDLVTGKRFFAHGGGDPGAYQLPVLYWFKAVVGGEQVVFEPHLIDVRTGVGTQLTVADVSGDGRPDVVVGNKLGTAVVFNRGEGDSSEELSDALKQVGTSEFAQGVRSTGPLTPEEERATFVLPAGFKAELVVAEPQIAKPMNMAFDADNRLWISSSREYPYAAPADREGTDTIVVLEDRDGDGHRETVTTFADGLNIPIGLYPYKDGVICWSIPNVWFLRDTDGDRRCDKREKLYGPMGFERDTHGMNNSFTRGFDGWLYACHGFNNQTTVAGTDGHEITMHSGNTYRMRLDGSRIEHFSHGLVNPFGMEQTPTGDLLVADCHTKPISLILPNGYYESFGKPHDGLGYVPNVMDHLHGSTAIGGMAQCQTDAWPAIYRGRTFGGNVMTSRVNMNTLEPHGSGIRAREEADFLIAGDSWFRPVDLQFGPDGALYVADFYNRIIGHYEVKLDHPGRDRTSGRIWKITYTGNDERRDAGSRTSVEPYEKPESADDLFAILAASDLKRRMVATDRLVDSHPVEAAQLAAAGLKHESETVRAHSIWILQRLRQLDDADLVAATSDSSELVRVHAFRVLRDRGENLPDEATLLRAGLSDGSPLVKREAVFAAADANESSLVSDLIRLYHNTPADDAFLRHSTRMALRDLLRNEGVLEQVSSSLQPADVKLVAGVCLALGTPEAGEFLVSHIDQLGDVDAATFAEYVKFAARYVAPDTVDRLTAVARERFGDDVDLQLVLLSAAREGLLQRGADWPPAVHQWALDLSSALMDLEQGQPRSDAGRTASWTYVPYPAGSTQDNPFVPTNRRTSTDGTTNTVLVSTIPKGEQRTGLRRSSAFRVDHPFSFYMAGHDGFPDKPANKLNFVRLRDANTHETLTTWYPPRNDTTHKFEWTPPAGTSPTVYLEVVDGDTASAYAWRAVGRFSIPGLNGSDTAKRTRQGVQLVSDFGLAELYPALGTILKTSGADLETASQVANALAHAHGDARLSGLAATVLLGGLTEKQRTAIYAAIAEGNVAEVPELLGQALKAATSVEQFRIAQALIADKSGASTLVDLAEKGLAAPSLLQRAEIADRIAAFKDADLQKRVDDLVAELPSLSAATEQLLATRRTKYLEQPGHAADGAALFKKNCSNCHQIHGQGTQVGPNLDGIGKRGLDRLLEDILDPNRNVDVNFRTTTVITDEGVVHSGLSRGIDGANLVLINNKGEKVTVPSDTIDEQVASRRSLMPENITESLNDEQFRNLVAWLLTQ